MEIFQKKVKTQIKKKTPEVNEEEKKTDLSESKDSNQKNWGKISSSCAFG